MEELLVIGDNDDVANIQLAAREAAAQTHLDGDIFLTSLCFKHNKQTARNTFIFQAVCLLILLYLLSLPQAAQMPLQLLALLGWQGA